MYTCVDFQGPICIHCWYLTGVVCRSMVHDHLIMISRNRIVGKKFDIHVDLGYLHAITGEI